jgi:lysophospholipase L1-like esterase
VKFVAFGDSLTEGKTYPAPTGELVLTETESYPFKLQRLLADRYLDQTVTVFNAGFAGESVLDGVNRAPKVLNAQKPNVLLLLHGANDLLAAGAADKTDAAIPKIVNALEDIVEAARARGVETMVATFPPQNGEGSRGSGASAVPELNDRIRQMASQEGAILVDLYAGFGGTPVGWVSIDGLHLTDTGYTKMAEIWFDAIRQHYETPVAAGAAPVLTVLGPGRRVPAR